ncbi:hypothetical protein PN36_12315 [Candidatus Thiomargarita nelsonii]|uniref:LamG-like jellyroll fold domain-containing protein n=1 Tax=Candidatus Thiomargarita nelsonii TaxID=1003181 RepID=A0A0A6P597_9GAMM|nr:hypothetical protein PN36_12315 [Candidatus Thiomargarita nelsonii]
MVKLRCWLRTILLIAIGLSWFSGAMADLNDGLVAYYPFDGNAQDESGNGNHGTVHGATLTEDRFGHLNSAYNFDGMDDCILANDSTTLDIQNNISLIAWIKTRGTDEGETGMIVAKHYTHWARAYALYERKVYYSQQYPDGITFSYVDDHNNDHVTITDRTDDNNWHLIVGTYNKSTGISELYVDGILKNSNNFGKIDLMQTSVPVSIGCYLNSADGSFLREFFHGTIDDVRIYNRALSESEVQQLYQMNNQPSDDCWATYDNGNLHIPCIKVKGPFDEDLHYEADMQYEPLSDPMTFQVTGVKSK